MNRSQAITDIRSIFANYRTAMRGDKKRLQALSDGKLYELFVLSHVLTTLDGRGFDIRFVGTVLKFKGGPGMVKLSDAHFELRDPLSGAVDWRVFVDIEFNTLGASQAAVWDSSRRHEIDIMVTDVTSGYPDHDRIALGVECKSTPHFKKGLLKEALGVRRELSYLDGPQQSPLAPSGAVGPTVHARPPSEYWLANLDTKISQYQQSPATFSIDLLHLKP
jgi:hypothetical protein